MLGDCGGVHRQVARREAMVVGLGLGLGAGRSLGRPTLCDPTCSLPAGARRLLVRARERMCVYVRERAREREKARETERGGDYRCAE